MTVVIGLTGSIGTGKSTVANVFKDLQIPVLDADQVSREVVEPGENTLQEIREVFGETIIQKDGRLDRKALGAIVFAEEKKRKQLNAIIHPAIRKRMEEKQKAWVDKKIPCLVVDIPLLFENKLTETVDKIIVVYVDEATQLKRIMSRDHIDEQAALQRMHSQISIEEKQKLADVVIDNRGTVAETADQIQTLLGEWDLL